MAALVMPMDGTNVRNSQKSTCVVHKSLHRVGVSRCLGMEGCTHHARTASLSPYKGVSLQLGGTGEAGSNRVNAQ
jgi:hypothetical protein